MKSKIKNKLTDHFRPTVLIITDESALHANHREGGALEGSHFKIKMISDVFQGMARIDRHQAVYQILNAELKGGIHALSLDLKTPSEFKTSKP